MIGLAYFGHILPVAEMLIFSIMGLSGTATTGGIVGLIDISPNFGGMLYASFFDQISEQRL